MEAVSGCLVILLSGSLIVTFAIRVLYVIYRSRKSRRKASTPRSTLIILGSGGHTAEMLISWPYCNDRVYSRFYIAAATDNMSLQKAQKYEAEISSNQVLEKTNYKTCPTNSDRRLVKGKIQQSSGQSYVTSIWTTLVAIAHALWLMIKLRPEVILCNSPGTCIPLCAIAFIFKVFGIRISLLYREHCKSKEAFLERPAPLQAVHG